MIFFDQLNRSVEIGGIPQRIISLVPSQTELLFDLGLEEKVCGITKFCVHPSHWKKTKAIVGGTKNLRMEVIRSLQPDLIIANKEENEQEQIRLLAQDFPVWISDINTIENACQMIQQVGWITGTASVAENIVMKVSDMMQETSPEMQVPLKVLYLIWKEPWMAVGGDTFIHSMITAAGFENATAHLHRYPALTTYELAALAPDLIFLSSEPYPFRDEHVAEMDKILPPATVLKVDGEAFSWYGSRMMQAFPYFLSLRSQIMDFRSKKLP